MRVFTIIAFLLTMLYVGGIAAYLFLREPPTPVSGATVTTIAGSDTLSSSRSVINTNFSNLNADVASLPSTSWPFTKSDTNFGVAVQSTTTPMWFKGNGTWGLFASSTSIFANASTTLFTTDTFWQTGASTSTFTGGVSMTKWATTATSSGSGINITDGCFSRKGACVGAAGATIAAITASTTVGTTQGAITVPAGYLLLVMANGSVDMDNTGANAQVSLRLGGQIVEITNILRTTGNSVPFAFSYATTTATTTTITLVVDVAGFDGATPPYITTLIMPQQPLTN